MASNANSYDELKFTLIDKVRNHPAIWDKNHEQHHNRYVLHQYWKRIAADAGMKEEKIKKVWRNLRQEFGKQARRILRGGCDTLDTANPSWPFFQSLLFLKEQFTGDNSTSANTTEADVDNNSEAFDEFQEEFGFDNQGMTPSPLRSRTPSEPSRSPPTNGHHAQYMNHQGPYSKKRKHPDPEDHMRAMALMEREEPRPRPHPYYEDSRDEDIGFFNSLLPHVRQLHPQQKMMFRMRVQQQLYELIYGPYDPQRLPYVASSSQGEPLCTAVYGNNQ